MSGPPLPPRPPERNGARNGDLFSAATNQLPLSSVNGSATMNGSAARTRVSMLPQGTATLTHRNLASVRRNETLDPSASRPVLRDRIVTRSYLTTADDGMATVPRLPDRSSRPPLRGNSTDSAASPTMTTTNTMRNWPDRKPVLDEYPSELPPPPPPLNARKPLATAAAESVAFAVQTQNGNSVLARRFSFRSNPADFPPPPPFVGGVKTYSSRRQRTADE